MWELSVGVVAVSCLVLGYRYMRGWAPWWESLAVLLPWWLTGDFALVVHGARLDLYLASLALGLFSMLRSRAELDWRRPHVALGIAVAFTVVLASTYGARLGALLELIKIATAVGAYLCVVASLRRPGDFERFIRLFLYSASAVLAFCIVQYLFIFDEAGLGTSLKSPILSKKNQVGMVVASIFPVALAYYGSERRLFHLSLLPVALTGTAAFFSYARASWLICLVIVVLALLALPWKRLAVATGSILATIALLFAFLSVQTRIGAVAAAVSVQEQAGAEQPAAFEVPLGGLVAPPGVSLEPISGSATAALEPEPGQHEAIVERLIRSVESMGVGGEPGYSVSTRLEMVSDGLRSFFKRPLFGEGFGTYSRTFKWNTFDSPHNDYVEIAVEQGLMGLIPYLSFLGVLLSGLWRAWRRSNSWIATAGLLLLVSRLAHGFFEIQYTTAFVWICFGLCAAALDLEETGKRSVACR